MKDAEILENVYTNMSTFIKEWAYEGKDYDLLTNRVTDMLNNVEEEYQEMAANAVQDVSDIIMQTVFDRS